MEDGWWPANRIAERLWKGKLCYVRVHGTVGFCRGDYGRHEMQKLGARMQSYVRANAGIKAYALFNNVYPCSSSSNLPSRRPPLLSSTRPGAHTRPA